MRYGFCEEHIFLEKEEIAKDAKLDDSFAYYIVNAINEATIRSFKEHAENHNTAIK